jgi:hypothetical protein
VQYLLTLVRVRGGIVEERFLAMELEDAWGQKTALSIGLAAIEINQQMDGVRLCRRFFWEGWACLCHLLRFLSGAFPPPGVFGNVEGTTLPQILSTKVALGRRGVPGLAVRASELSFR